MPDLNDDGFGDAPQREEQDIPHQSATEGVIDEHLRETSTQAAVTNLVAITGGESPTEAEHNALLNRVNLLTQVLRDAELIPSS